MEALKPCPFCGGKAEIAHSRNYYAWCDKCETRGDWYSTEAEAIQAWNTREERTCENVDEYAGNGFFICGNCGFGKDGIELTPRYCPDCGAKVVE